MTATQTCGTRTRWMDLFERLRAQAKLNMELAQNWRACRDGHERGDLKQLTTELIRKLKLMGLDVDGLIQEAARYGGITEIERQALAYGAAFVTARRWLPTVSAEQSCQGYRAIDDTITCLQQMAIWLTPQD